MTLLRLPGGSVALREAAQQPDARPASVDGRFALLDRSAAEGIADEWRALSERSAEDNLFFGPDFALEAMRAFGGGVAIAAWRRRDGGLAALAPVTRTRLGRVAPAMRLWSHDYGPLAVPLIDREHVGEAVRGLLEGLASSGSLILPDFWLGGEVADAVRGFAAERGRPLVVAVEKSRAMRMSGADAADCRAQLAPRRRKQFSRQMRRLSEIGAVTIDAVGETALFEAFLSLEASGWKGRGGTAMARIGPIVAMARRIVAAKASRDALRINAIRLDGRPIAMLVSFLSGRTAYTWKIAYDESFARFSPGAQLMLDAGTSLLSIAGIDRVDSCAEANHPMVDHVWKDRRAIGTVLIGPPGGGLMFRAGLAAMQGESAARAAAKELIRKIRT